MENQLVYASDVWRHSAERLRLLALGCLLVLGPAAALAQYFA